MNPTKAITEGKMLPPPPPARDSEAEGLSALEMEFEQTWDGAGDLDEDDLDRMRR